MPPNPYQPYQTPNYSLAPQQPMQPGLQAPGAMAPPQGVAGAPPVDPALVEQILRMNQTDPQQQAINRQLKLADAMRADAKGQLAGQTVGGRGHEQYIPPSLLNLGASLFGNYGAGKTEDAATAREQALGVQTTDAMRNAFEGLTGKRKRPALPSLGEE